MPVNPGIDFKLAEDEFKCARTDAEKLRALEKMYAKCPKHKGSESVLKEIKTKIAKLRDRIDKARKKKGYSYHIKKEGAAMVVLAGVTNCGKSTLLKELTNSNPEIAAYEYTTKSPEIGIMEHHGIKIQIVEFPALFKGCSDKDKYPTYFSAVRNSDLIIAVVDGTRPAGNQLKLIQSEFHNSFINLGGNEKGNQRIVGIKTLVTVNKRNRKVKTKFPVFKIERIRTEIWKHLEMIYVYTKSPGKERDFPPVALPTGSTVKDLAAEVHKNFIRRFRFARMWGKSVKHPGSKTGLEHKLKEEDVVELHLK